MPQQGLPWWANMILGAVANFIVVYVTLTTAGTNTKQALLGALASTLAPFIGTPYQSRLNPDGTPSKVSYVRPDRRSPQK